MTGLKPKLQSDIMDLKHASLKTSLTEAVRSLGCSRPETLAALEKQNFPDRRQEEWKYSVPVFLSDAYRIALARPHAAPVFPDPSVRGIRLVFSGGHYLPEAGSVQLPAGLEIVKHTGTSGITPSEDNLFSTLNEATSSDFGITLQIKKNTVLDEPILLIHSASESLDWLQPCIRVEAGEGSSACFAEIHSGGASTVTNLVNEILLEQGAQLSWLSLEDGAKNSTLVNQTRVALQRDARFRHTVLSCSRGFVRNNLDVRIGGKGAHADLFGLSLGADNAHCDHHSFVHHSVENSSSNQLYKGIFAGKSTGVFNGKILVDQIAQKTNAYQSGRNILLSADARVYAKPQLEIFADDVKCSHGATIGQLDEEPLFYLRSRGLDLAGARLLLVKAFAGEILSEVENDSLRSLAEELVLVRLDELTKNP